LRAVHAELGCAAEAEKVFEEVHPKDDTLAAILAILDEHERGIRQCGHEGHVKRIQQQFGRQDDETGIEWWDIIVVQIDEQPATEFGNAADRQDIVLIAGLLTAETNTERTRCGAESEDLSHLLVVLSDDQCASSVLVAMRLHHAEIHQIASDEPLARKQAIAREEGTEPRRKRCMIVKAHFTTIHQDEERHLQ
jgi:hypothetical protein